MGKITSYINILYKNLAKQKELLSQNNNEFERVDIQYEIISIQEEITNATKTLESLFNGEDIINFAKEVMPEEDYNKVVVTFNEKNESLKQRYEDNLKGLIKSRKTSIDQLKYKSPNFKEEGDPHYPEYQQLLKDIEEYNAQLENPKPPVTSFINLIDQRYIEGMIKKIGEKAEELDNAEELAEQLEAFLPVDKSDKGVQYPVKETLKKITLGINTSYEVKQMIFDNEEEINELTAIDSNASTSKMYSNKISKIEPIVERKGKQIFLEAVKEYKLEDITNFSDHAFSSAETKEQLERVYSDDLKFEYSENTKQLFTELLKEMEYRNMVPEDAKVKEDGSKYYAFAKYAMARNNFVEVTNAQEFNNDEFKDAWSNLDKETKNIEAMYKLIDKKLGTSYEAMPTNVDTFRTSYIPRRFKQNAAHNAQLNGLFITLTLIKSHGLTIEEFMENPAEALKKAVKQDADKLNADKMFKDKTKAEVLFQLADPMYKANSIDVYGYIRAVEFLNGIETDPALKRKNSMITMGLLNGFGKIKSAIESSHSILSYGNISENIRNVFLAEKDEETGEISYNDCYSEQVGRVGADPVEFEEFVGKTYDPKTGLLQKDKPSSLDKVADMYLFEEKFYEMMTIIKQYKNCVKDPQNAGKMQNLSIKKLVTAAQELTAQYILTHDFKEMNQLYDNPIRPGFVKEMTDFIKDPALQTALNGVDVANMGNETLAKMIKNKDSVFAKKEKDINKYIKDVLKVEDNEYINEVNAINKAIDELDKQAERIEKQAGKAGKGKTNDQIEEIAMRQRELTNQLLAAQDRRIEALRLDYEKGRIPKYFYDKRVEQLATGNIKDLGKLPPLFKVDDPDYKNFNTYMRNVVSKIPAAEREGKTEEEFRKDYNEIKYNARIEKSTYLAERALAEKGIRAAKALNSENEFTVKTTKLELNAEAYKNEFDNYKENNKDKIISIEVPEASEELLIPNAENVEKVEEISKEKTNEINELIG